MWLKIVEHTYWCCASVTGFHLDMVQWHMSGIKNITTCKYWQHVAIIRPNSNFWLVCVYCAHNAFMRMQPRIVVISVVQVYWVAPLYGGLVCESMHNCYQDQSMQSSIWSCYIRLRARFITNQIPSQYHLDMSVIWHKFCMVLRLKYMCFFSWYASAWMVSRKEKKKTIYIDMDEMKCDDTCTTLTMKNLVLRDHYLLRFLILVELRQTL